MRPPDPINILLVDDQPAKLLSYEAVLVDLGENLIKAGSARDALEQLLKREIAVILVDVCMPELDGFQLAEMIRDHPRFKRTAIVFISAVQLGDEDRVRGYQLGAVDYVPVPIVPELLRAKVRVFADLYRATKQLERLNQELELRVAERTAELEASNAQLKLAIEVGRLGTWAWDLADDSITWSDGHFTLLGYRPDEVVPSFEAWRERLHPQDRDCAEAIIRTACASSAPYQHVYRSVHPSGATVWCEARGQYEFDATGAPRRMIGVVMDISEHKLAEERQQLMIHELHHRVNNTLATVQAIASLTARHIVDPESFSRSFGSRIQALSKTHTMLVANNWNHINLRDLLMTELGSFQDESEKRIDLSGPSVELPSRIALSLGLAVHELTTNAVKHGALSDLSGHIRVGWSLRRSETGDSTLELSWTETGGPRVNEITRQGFGSLLLGKIFGAQTGAKSSMTFEPTGLKFEALVPLPAKCEDDNLAARKRATPDLAAFAHI